MALLNYRLVVSLDPSNDPGLLIAYGSLSKGERRQRRDQGKREQQEPIKAKTTVNAMGRNIFPSTRSSERIGR